MNARAIKVLQVAQLTRIGSRTRPINEGSLNPGLPRTVAQGRYFFQVAALVANSSQKGSGERTEHVRELESANARKAAPGMEAKESRSQKTGGRWPPHLASPGRWAN